MASTGERRISRRTSPRIRKKISKTISNSCVSSSSSSSSSSPATIKSLPMDLLVEILALVASKSFIDLFNAKFCCKEFREAADNGYVFQHVSLHHKKFPVLPWREGDDNVKSFLKRCKENGSAEVLYREGMIDYFSRMKPETGVENLRKAAEKGHAEASYVYAIILLLTKGMSDKKGGELLYNITIDAPGSTQRSAVRSSSLKECRKRAYEIIGAMWGYEVDSVLKDERQRARRGGRLPCLRSHNHNHNHHHHHSSTVAATSCRPINIWLYLMDQDFEEWCCKNCLIYHETIAFCSLLDHHLIPIA